jgi:hypothetical protein
MDLGFKEIAVKAFMFLETQYGFKCVESGQWSVRYESELVCISVYFDGARSFELGCSLERLNSSRSSCSNSLDLGDLLRYKAGSVEGSSFQVTTKNALKKFTSLLAEKLGAYGHEILLGDNLVFDRVVELRDLANLDYAREGRLEEISHSLEIAWKAKKYQEVVELLAPAKKWLTATEVKKLEYARKHTNKLRPKEDTNQP